MDRSKANEEEQDAVSLVQGLFLRHSDLIRSFIRRLLADHLRSDDVLQETFRTVTRKAADFETGTDFPKWACAIARFKVLEERRRMRRDALLLSEKAILALSATEEAFHPDPRIDRLEECLCELPATMRRTIDLRYFGDHTPAEISRLIGWKVESVYVALSRARKMLRDCLTRPPGTTHATPAP